VGGQLGPVVAADVLRGAALGDEGLKHADGLLGGDAAIHAHRQYLPGELVDDVQQPQHPPVGCLVVLVVQRPQLVGALGPQPLSFGITGPAALARLLRHAQPFLAPQALHALAVDYMAVLAQMAVRATVPPPGLAPGGCRATAVAGRCPWPTPRAAHDAA